LTDYRFKPQLRTLGRRFGRQLAQVTALLQSLDGRQAMAELRRAGVLTLDLDGTAVTLAEEDLLIETVQPEGLATESDRDFTVALDTRLTDELIEEGFVREIVSKVQTMRKESGFEVTDRIVLRHDGNDRISAIIARHTGRIGEEVLAVRIECGVGPNSRDWDLNGEPCRLSVERV
jgi:isoleucyl-tRNA synthetase